MKIHFESKTIEITKTFITQEHDTTSNRKSPALLDFFCSLRGAVKTTPLFCAKWKEKWKVLLIFPSKSAKVEFPKVEMWIVG